MVDSNDTLRGTSSFTSQFFSSNTYLTSRGLKLHLVKKPKVPSGPPTQPSVMLNVDPTSGPPIVPCLFIAQRQREFRVRRFVCAVRYDHLIIFRFESAGRLEHPRQSLIQFKHINLQYSLHNCIPPRCEHDKNDHKR